MNSNGGVGTDFDVSGEFAALRFWRNTVVASLAANGSVSLGDLVLGYEWDEDLDNGYRPAGLIDLSSTTRGVTQYIQDYGSNFAAGTATHSLTLYKAASGALVFSAGTIQYSWALDDYHAVAGAATDRNLQQATVNLLADMGAQPGSLMAGLVRATASTDNLAPVSVILSPLAGASLPPNTNVTVRGTAQERGGGVVAEVEVSVDGGISWHRADGRENWSYTFVTRGSGSFSILSRAVDDSANVETNGPRIDVNPSSNPGIYSLWSDSDVPSVVDSGDKQALEVGFRFTSDSNGLITGLRFYKSAANTGTHIANLWTSTGQLLATATFTTETASGWQQANFAAPVAISAGVTYVASYFAPNGHFSTEQNYFSTEGISNGPLHAIPTGSAGGNGVFRYGATSGFPTLTYLNTNYWVDVVFRATPPLDSVAPTVVAFSPSASSTGVSVTTPVTITFSEAIDPTSVTAGTVKLIDSEMNLVPTMLLYNAGTKTVTLTPSSPLAFGTTYTIVATGGIFGVKDMAGNPISQTVGSSFTTLPVAAPDLVPPTVTGVSPSNGSINIAPNSVFTISFSEGLSAATINTSNVLLLKNATNHVTAGVSYNASNRTITITPSAALENATSYTIYILGGSTGVADLNGNAMVSSYVSSFTTAAAATASATLWPSTVTPGTVDTKEASALELGVKFTADTNGYITGLRFYKSAGNTGTHLANLWTSTGQLLATATFTSESASGWQQVNFATPVAITAGTTYVASYYTSSGHFSVDRNYFATAFNSGSLHVAAGGGVFQYAGASAFPTQTYQNSNYWVDVMLSATPPADTVPPIVTSTSPANGATNVATNTPVTIFFSEAMNSATISNSTVKLLDGASLVTASVAYNSSNKSATITPTVALTSSKVYTISIVGGVLGVKDVAGNSLAQSYSSTFTTAAAATASATLWPSTVTPGTVDTKEASALELGVKFTADTNGYITGLRFYKSAGNTGTHLANLWTSTGQLLATATFTSESASGWQQVNFATPVAITAGTTYVASYYTSSGHFSVDRNYFATAFNSGSLHVAAGGGVFQYAGASAFPTQTYQNSNYWVDVMLSATPPADTVPPIVTSTSPANGATNVATNTPVTIFFSEAMNSATISNSTVKLLDGASLVTASVAYNSSNKSATITPTVALTSSKVYTISIVGGVLGVKDVAGNPLAQTLSSTFTTAAALPVDTTPPTVSGASPGNNATNVSISASITVTFSEPLNPATVTTSIVRLLDGSTPVAATVNYDPTNRTATIVPASALANSRTYTISVLGGSNSVKDIAGNSLAQSYSSTFTTAAAATASATLWPSTVTPGTVDTKEASALELGVKFTADTNGYITGLRFYKSAGNTGTHLANLWTSTGQLLATATFTSESASGWQQVNFATPVAITAGTTYVASYYTSSGHFSVDRNYFATAFNSGSLHVAAGGGVFQYAGASAFPTQTYQNSNYWVDLMFVASN